MLLFSIGTALTSFFSRAICLWFQAISQSTLMLMAIANSLPLSNIPVVSSFKHHLSIYRNAIVLVIFNQTISFKILVLPFVSKVKHCYINAYLISYMSLAVDNCIIWYSSANCLDSGPICVYKGTKFTKLQNYEVSWQSGVLSDKIKSCCTPFITLGPGLEKNWPKFINWIFFS